jgi:integrase
MSHFVLYQGTMKIRPFGEGKFRADAGVILGRRTTRVFETKKDAELWLKGQAKVRAEDRLGFRGLSRTDELLAIDAFKELDQHKLAHELLHHAVRTFCETASPDNPTLLSEAIKVLEKDLRFKNSSQVYIDQIIRQLGRFVRDFPGVSIHEITPEQIQEWLEQKCGSSAANRKNRRREINVLFSKMVQKGLLKVNPVDRISRVIVDRGRPDILTLGQVQSALKNLDGQDRALFAVMTFAGLRPSEAEALHWEDVKLDRGFLEAKRGQRADNRNVTLSTNLVAWLRPLAGEGSVFKGHVQRWRRRVQQAIAIASTPLNEWPQDVLRHSYASYHLEKHKNANDLAHEMGHRGNAQMLYAHYRQLVTPEDARAFWEIAP